MLKARLAHSKEIPLLLKWAQSKRNRGVNFKMSIKDPDTKKLIVHEMDKPIGVVIVDPHEGEISIFLVPRQHGKGKGVRVLYEAHDWIRRYYPDIGYIWAQCGSIASIRLFESMGYERQLFGDWVRNI